MTKDQYKIVRLTAIGGALEFYDFTIYALFAPYISHHFFPNSNSLLGLMNTFLVFALGYFARPLGGIVFGYIGDKFGRKSAFSLTVLMMASTTFFIGCLPDYQSIGIIAPLGLIGLRLLQGFSVGGEIPGAAIFTVEHVLKNKRGFSIGIVFMCITLGNSLGALVGICLTSILNQEQMMSWGWRIPFIIGFLLGIISYIIRKKTHETPEFMAIMEKQIIQRNPLTKLFQSSGKQLLKGFLLTAPSSSIISLFLFLPTYLSNIIQLDVSYSYVINLVTFVCFALMTALFGWLSDYVDRKKLLTTGALLLFVFSYPLFHCLVTSGETFVWAFGLGFAILGGIINGSYVVLIAESFPASIRYSGVGLSYSLGIALFGGIAPLAFTWLIQLLQVAEGPSIYLLICALLSFLAILSHPQDSRIPKTANATS